MKKALKYHSPIVPSSLKKILKRTQGSITEKVGLPPGSIVYTGQPKDGKTGITLTRYDENKVFQTGSDNLKEITEQLDPEQVNWIIFDSLHDTDLITETGRIFGIHSLTLEDIVHVNHPPKIEEYENYLFITLKMVNPFENTGTFRIEHICFVLLDNKLILFQEFPNKSFNNIVERIKTGKGRARGRGPDYLLFLLVDAIVDQYLHAIETIGKQIDYLEMKVFENPNEQIVSEIVEQKKIIAALRKIFVPAFDSIKALTTGDSHFLSDEYLNYYNDVFDHIKNIVALLDNQREVLTSLMEFQMASVSYQMNKVMQVLTIIATIFIPLTFLAGIYGMNFKYMPELTWKWSYPLVLLIMLFLGLGMYFYMKRKKWF